MNARELGRRGERRAMWFYLLRGYWIVARNVRFRHGEIDLIVRRGRTLAFVEVKTRRNLVGGHGFEAVDSRKRTRIVELGDEYLAKHPHRCEVRYDVVSLEWTGWRFIVTHFADAFRVIADPHQPWRWRV